MRVLDANAETAPLRPDPEPLAGRGAGQDVVNGAPMPLGVVRPCHPKLVPEGVARTPVLRQGQEAPPRNGGVPSMTL